MRPPRPALGWQALAARQKTLVSMHSQRADRVSQVLAARHKTLVAEKAELETAQRTLSDLEKAVTHHTPFITHATPFFDWLAASDDDSEEEEAAAKPTSKEAAKAVDVE